MASAGFPHRLGRQKPRASTSRGPLTKMYNIFVIVIDFYYTVMVSFVLRFDKND
jgi:hypothetical protein